MNSEITVNNQALPPELRGTSRGPAPTSILSKVLLAIAFLFVAVRALPILTFPLGSDQGAYLMIGEGMLQGKHLYRDLLDTKPPGIFIVYSGIDKLIGRAMWSAALADIFLLFLISYLLYRFTKPYLGTAGAALAVMVHASLHGEMKYFFIGQPETFQLPCVLAGYLLMRRRGRWSGLGCFAAGLLLGFACWLKYNALAFLPFLVLLPFLDTAGFDLKPPRVSLSIPWRSWLAKAALVFAGLAAAFCLVMGWIVVMGAWPAMAEMQFKVLPRYAAMGFESRSNYLIAVISRTNFYMGEWTLWATVAGLLIAWRRRDLIRFAPVFLAGVSAYAAVVMQVRMHDYYFQTTYPFVAAIWAYVAINIY